MCEYANIFPYVSSFLDHMLFTIGNGYRYDSKSGLPQIGDFPVNEYPSLNEEQWKELIAECHKKEKSFAEQFAGDDDIDLAYLDERCARYKVISVNDDNFTEDALYNELVSHQRYIEENESWAGYLRPYPLAKSYSIIYKLDKNTPRWFTQIAVNFCQAWVRFLGKMINENNIKPLSDEPDYGDINLTIKYRDMIAKRTLELQELLNEI